MWWMELPTFTLMLAQVPRVSLPFLGKDSYWTLGYGLEPSPLRGGGCHESDLQMFRILLWFLQYYHVFHVLIGNFICLSFFLFFIFFLSPFSFLCLIFQEQPPASSPALSALAHLAYYLSSRYSMATLKVISYDVWALCSPGKHSKLR